MRPLGASLPAAPDRSFRLIADALCHDVPTTPSSRRSSPDGQRRRASEKPRLSALWVLSVEYRNTPHLRARLQLVTEDSCAALTTVCARLAGDLPCCVYHQQGGIQNAGVHCATIRDALRPSVVKWGVRPPSPPPRILQLREARCV